MPKYIDEEEEYEKWFLLKPYKNKLKEYLSNEIGILTLIENSSIYIAKRFYDTFDEISNIEEIKDIDIIDGLPLKDIKLEINLYDEILKEKTYNKNYEVILDDIIFEKNEITFSLNKIDYIIPNLEKNNFNIKIVA